MSATDGTASAGGHAPRGNHGGADRRSPPQPLSPASLQRLRELLREQGGLIASLLTDDYDVADDRDAADLADLAGNGSCPAQLVARGPRARAAAPDYELLVELIYEGYLLHYRLPRLLRPPDADLALLAGDRLYALGLARLVALGDLPAVAELADVITLTALAHGAGEPELAAAVWDAGALAVGWGPSEPHARAKALAREGAPEALEAMRALLPISPAAVS